MRLRALQFLCLAVLLAGVLAPSAAAGPALSQGHAKQEAELTVTTAAFGLEGSNGYRIAFFALSERLDGHGRLYVSVGRSDGGAFYSVPAIVSEAFVRADLGTLGRVDLAAHPSGREKKIDIKCSRQAFPFEPVAYEGIVEFKGEGGYTNARATRVAARPLITSFCGSSGYGESSGPREVGARLRGLSFAHGRRLSFQVNKNHQHAKTLFTAELKERHEGIFIHRTVEGVASASAFTFDPDLRSARLNPPAPFSGAATLTRDPNSISPRWTGNLTLDFPGRPNVHLAGPQVNVSLAHARYTRSSNPSVAIRSH